MNANYSNIIDTRIRWLRWYNRDIAVPYENILGEKLTHKDVWDPAHIYDTAVRRQITEDNPIYNRSLRIGYEESISILKKADSYYVNDKFCELAAAVVQTIPPETEFDVTWMPSQCGFMWLDKPLMMPQLEKSIPLPDLRKIDNQLATVRAFGWFSIPPGSVVHDKICGRDSEVPNGAVYLVAYMPLADGFTPWSFMTLRHGDKLADRIKLFESVQADGQYADKDFRKHELAFVYALLALMSQRLTMKIEHDVDRSLRRRMERESDVAIKIPPAVKVVTLRKMEEGKKKADFVMLPTGQPRNWHWQWYVEPFWRKQYYPTLGIHKPKLILGYIKGPSDKPFKPPSHRMFVAAR